MTSYDVGDVAVLTATFSVGGTPTNPTAVTLTVVRRDGTTVAGLTVTNPTTGTYRAEVPISNVPGHWHYRWVGTGAAASAEEGQFNVDPSDVL